MFISATMRNNGIRPADTFDNSFTVFLDENNYGESYKCPNKREYMKTMADLSIAVNAGLCVPQSTGELILMRQEFILQSLNILIEDILDASSTRVAKKPPKKSTQASRAAIYHLTIAPEPPKASLLDLEERFFDQKSSLVEHLNLCRTEPGYLAPAVNVCFFTRPELIQDEKGRSLPFHTDRNVSIALFEVIHNAVAAPANWDYLSRLLRLLRGEELRGKTQKNAILQEISNVCHLEYGRMQAIFKRYLQLGTGSKYFKRLSGVYDFGVPRVVMKIKPETLMKDNPQLNYMLRLCQPETDATKAVEWIKKLDELYKAKPFEREAAEEREFDSFSDFAAITSIIQSLSATQPLPPPRPKNGRSNVSRVKDLAAELDSAKSEVDLSRFAVPIDNLLEPGMAHDAIVALEQFIAEKTGTRLEFLYQDLIESCISEISDHDPKRANLEVPAPASTGIPTPDAKIQQRREKENSRSEASSAFSIVPPTNATQPEVEESTPVFKVKQATFDVFSKLLSKSQPPEPIPWTSFEAAMADLDFSAILRPGSVFTFIPPEGVGSGKSITLHRPHSSLIKGPKLFVLAKRLRTTYGWGEQTFKLA